MSPHRRRDPKQDPSPSASPSPTHYRQQRTDTKALCSINSSDFRNIFLTFFLESLKNTADLQGIHETSSFLHPPSLCNKLYEGRIFQIRAANLREIIPENSWFGEMKSLGGYLGNFGEILTDLWVICIIWSWKPCSRSPSSWQPCSRYLVQTFKGSS